ncbi:MAG TPA: ABC transporter permease [Thermoanaerobaculia bacterium]|nr:ABC transporter permease [Thermoanaerobaculia bacterium]
MIGSPGTWWRRALSSLRRSELDADLDQELAFHVEAAVEENLRRGMAPAEARRRAMLQLGGVGLVRELHREARGLPVLESVAQDVRYALRTLRRSPGFTLLAVAILALGIGANTAIFSLVNAVLLRPLPFPQPDRLVLLWVDFSARGAPARVEPTPADYAAWKEQSRSFEDLAAFVTGTYNLTGNGDPERLSGVRTTANLFGVLGMQALLGRTLEPYDEEPQASPVAVVNERLWRSRFGGDPGLVGRTIVLNELAHTVVGVVPPDFQFPDQDAAVWLPAKFTPEELAQSSAYVMSVVARLAPTVTLAQARAEMTAIGERLAVERPGTNQDVGVAVAPAHEHLTRDARPALFILSGAVGLLLLIACANLANLLLARGSVRRKELALREAIGAARGRVVRQLLTESAVLAGLGVAVGVWLSTVSFAYLARLVPSGLPPGASPSLDLSVLAFTAGVAALQVLAFGTGPALAATRGGWSGTLGAGIGRGTTTPGGGRLRDALVVSEITLTIVLLVAAGLLLRSYANVLAVEPGFEPRNLLIAETALSPSRYAAGGDRSTFYERVLERVRALPGVSSAGYATIPPLVFKGGRTYVTIEGRPAPRPEDFLRHVVSDRAVSAGYLPALEVPLLRGRHFDQRDGPGSVPAVIINQSMADLHWPNQDPIGHRIKIGGRSIPWFTIVGVVGSMRQTGLDVPAEPEMYLSAGQLAESSPFQWPRYLAIRTERAPLELAAAVRAAVWAVDPDQPVSDLRSMEEVFDAELSSRNTQMTLIGAFAALALAMAAVGLYGALSYMVARRTAEIGVRMALGAPRARVVGQIVGAALLLAAFGLALGLAGAFGLSRLLASQLFEVSPTDPATFVAASILVVVVTTLASFVPARRAAAVDPVSVLRAD